MTKPLPPPWLRQSKAELSVSSQADRAEMRIYGPIHPLGQDYGCVSADEFGQALSDLAGVKPVTIHMHSPGGSAHEGIAILNQIRQHAGPTEIIVDGLAASAASVICMGADVVTMAPGAEMMIHEAANGCWGAASDMEAMRAVLDHLSENVADQYAAKAGGMAAQWRAAMQSETWYGAEEAVAAGLADRILANADTPGGPEMKFDLSGFGFAFAGRAFAPPPAMYTRTRTHVQTQTPAEPSGTPPIHTKEAGPMSDTLIDGLRERLGLSEDADITAVLAAVDAARDPDPTPEAIAKAYGVSPAAVAAALEGAQTGKVTVSQAYLDTLKEGADAGRQALARQSREDRDKAIAAAQDAGKIGCSKEAVASWQAAWDRDPGGTEQEIAELGVRFPTGPTSGYAGSDGSDGQAEIDAENAALDQLAGVRAVS